MLNLLRQIWCSHLWQTRKTNLPMVTLAGQVVIHQVCVRCRAERYVSELDVTPTSILRRLRATLRR